MGRSGCSEKKSKNNKKNMVGVGVGLKKGPWTQEEDQKLLAYIQQFGDCSWRALPAKAGLKRCGKSCRLRWKNYLRPDIKIEKFSLEEERTIIQLHALLGNRWSAIATHLPKRTDSKIKNHWNSHIKKQLAKMGIDPETHKRKTNTSCSNLSHMAQWEAARLEAEARLVHKPKHFVTPPSTHELHKRPTTIPPCLDVLKVWEGTLTSKSFINGGLQTPHSTSSFLKDVPPTVPATLMMNYVENKGSFDQEVTVKRHGRPKTLMERPFEEFVYPFDANFIFGDPIRSPGLWEGFVDRPINGAGDREIMNDGWNSLHERLAGSVVGVLDN